MTFFDATILFFNSFDLLLDWWLPSSFVLDQSGVCLSGLLNSAARWDCILRTKGSYESGPHGRNADDSTNRPRIDGCATLHIIVTENFCVLLLFKSVDHTRLGILFQKL